MKAIMDVFYLFAGKEKNQVSRIKKLKRRISASFGRLCEYDFCIFVDLFVDFIVVFASACLGGILSENKHNCREQQLVA